MARTNVAAAEMQMLHFTSTKIGAVAQLGERRVRNAKVRGSIPLGSTTFPIVPLAFALSTQAPVAQLDRAIAS